MRVRQGRVAKNQEDTVSASKIYVGMDVHKETITIAAFVGGKDTPEPVVKLPHDFKKVRKHFDRLSKLGEIAACYEASGAGYVLQRGMTDWGYSCEVVAPSMIPKRPGDRRKTDTRDAIDLARLYRSGDLVPVHIPAEAEERVRDLVRCRGAMQKMLISARHQVTKFLARRALVFRDGAPWGTRHMTWLSNLRASGQLVKEDRTTFDEYLSMLEFATTRRDSVDHAVETAAELPVYAEKVGLLRCFYGINVLTAMVLLTEVGNFSRFKTPRELMAYLGLVPREYSSGERERRGSITKSGNSRVRHVLVQAAWTASKIPRSVHHDLKRRREGQPAYAVAHAMKARKRLYERFKHLSSRRGAPKAAVAVARELSGFVWAVMRTAEAELSLRHT
jgi:transposase